MRVVGRDITYYGEKYLPNNINALDLVFYKPNSFIHEDEYRIALFYPEDKSGFQDYNGIVHPFIGLDSQHMNLRYPEKEFLKHFIGETIESKA